MFKMKKSGWVLVGIVVIGLIAYGDFEEPTVCFLYA